MIHKFWINKKSKKILYENQGNTSFLFPHHHYQLWKVNFQPLLAIFISIGFELGVTFKLFLIIFINFPDAANELLKCMNELKKITKIVLHLNFLIALTVVMCVYCTFLFIIWLVFFFFCLSTFPQDKFKEFYWDTANWLFGFVKFKWFWATKFI